MEKDKKKIIVMGGSFNPPTLAHYKLMKVAIDVLGAEIGCPDGGPRLGENSLKL